MKGIERREQILQILGSSDQPVSGSALAARLSVSRQVIVQDIALLRTEHPILATAQGYLLYERPEKKCRRSFLVKHTSDEIKEELDAIVALGGRILDVIVEHDVYGQIQADLNLSTLEDVDYFCYRLSRSTSGPLFPISAGIHLHTVEAMSETILDEIEQALLKKGFLTV